jgi:CO/xanthine dehydrogenase FAD-binding subunit
MLTFAGTFQVYIGIKNITHLREIHHREDGLLLGASVTIADAIAAFEEPPPGGKLGRTRVSSPFAELAAHMRQVATPQVRHVASVAGETSQGTFS